MKKLLFLLLTSFYIFAANDTDKTLIERIQNMESPENSTLWVISRELLPRYRVISRELLPRYHNGSCYCIYKKDNSDSFILKTLDPPREFHSEKTYPGSTKDCLDAEFITLQNEEMTHIFRLSDSADSIMLEIKTVNAATQESKSINKEYLKILYHWSQDRGSLTKLAKR